MGRVAGNHDRREQPGFRPQNGCKQRPHYRRTFRRPDKRPPAPTAHHAVWAKRCSATAIAHRPPFGCSTASVTHWQPLGVGPSVAAAFARLDSRYRSPPRRPRRRRLAPPTSRPYRQVSVPEAVAAAPGERFALGRTGRGYDGPQQLERRDPHPIPRATRGWVFRARNRFSNRSFQHAAFNASDLVAPARSHMPPARGLGSRPEAAAPAFKDSPSHSEAGFSESRAFSESPVKEKVRDIIDFTVRTA